MFTVDNIQFNICNILMQAYMLIYYTINVFFDANAHLVCPLEMNTLLLLSFKHSLCILQNVILIIAYIFYKKDKTRF